MQADSKKKFRAVLVGGLVVGVGAAVTLAAWNDSEFAQGTFASGQFNLEGSTTSSTEGFADHPSSEDAAALTFEVNPENMSPNDSVYAPFSVRLDETTTNDASVDITAAAGGTTTGMSYRLIQTEAFGCDSDTAGTDLVPAGTALGSVSGAAAFDLAKGAAASAGEATNLCFIVTADDDMAQDQTGTSTWEFTATSKDS
ncbi:MAG: SipW-dependent-type signal peptide-containing protein [Micrococcaceae bacterium]|nr:SipW-dependent-type signal peptide-containing protein [Micrococcaceae bacterium]